MLLYTGWSLLYLPPDKALLGCSQGLNPSDFPLNLAALAEKHLQEKSMETIVKLIHRPSVLS